MAESNSRVLIVSRLNAIVNELDLRVAILGSIQSMGYDSPTESQKSAIDKFVRGYDVFISLRVVVNRYVTPAFQGCLTD